MFQDGGPIQIEKKDQSYRCKWLNNAERTCPLMEALVLGAVLLDGDLTVMNCGFFERKTNLKVVKEEK